MITIKSVVAMTMLTRSTLTDVVVFVKDCDPLSEFIRVEVRLHIGDLYICLST